MAIDLGFKNIIIEGDNKIIIDALRGVSFVPWQVLPLIRDVRMYLQKFHEVQIQHVFREANRAIDFFIKIRAY